MPITAVNTNHAEVQRGLGDRAGGSEEMAMYLTIVAWRIPWTEELAGYSQWGLKELDMAE